MGEEDLLQGVGALVWEAVSEREARFHSRLLDEVDAAVVATDLEGTVTHWEPELVERILDDANRAGVQRERIVIEITETGAMTDWEHTEGVLRDLRDHGFRLAIDDFGSGHSSLARLGSLPADPLKIDRSFVAGLPDDATSAMMVRAMIQPTENLGMEALAEGIETQEQLRFVVEAGCRRGQGFLFSRAVPAAAVASL